MDFSKLLIVADVSPTYNIDYRSKAYELVIKRLLSDPERQHFQNGNGYSKPTNQGLEAVRPRLRFY